MKDFRYPPKTVIGELDQASGDILETIYKRLEAPLIRKDLESAEMVDNCWHALKIGFANEIGNLCKSLGLDAHTVMKIVCQDRSSNLPSVPLARFRVWRLMLAKGSSGIVVYGKNA